jgi:hypothetical protein
MTFLKTVFHFIETRFYRIRLRCEIRVKFVDRRTFIVGLVIFAYYLLLQVQVVVVLWYFCNWIVGIEIGIVTRDLVINLNQIAMLARTSNAFVLLIPKVLELLESLFTICHFLGFLLVTLVIHQPILHIGSD